MPFEFDRIEDFLEGTWSPEWPELFDWNENVPEELVSLLDRFANIELLFICSVYARMLSGEGGPSIAGSSDSDCATAYWRVDVGEFS